jgi:hypothetical protein
MITVDGVEYPSHKEYFEKYPWMIEKNRTVNWPILLKAYSQHCADCGLRWHPAIMTLDHIARDGYKTSTGKRMHPSEMVKYPPPTFLAELRKCEPVCRNCHTMREFVRDGYLKKPEYVSLGTSALLGQDAQQNEPRINY